MAAKLAACKPVVGAIVAVVALSAVSGGTVYADLAQDSVANVNDVNELSREAEQLSETILNAQPDLDKKLQLLGEADKKRTDDLARLEVTKAQLDTHQRAVDEFAAAA